MRLLGKTSTASLTSARHGSPNVVSVPVLTSPYPRRRQRASTTDDRQFLPEEEGIFCALRIDFLPGVGDDVAPAPRSAAASRASRTRLFGRVRRELRGTAPDATTTDARRPRGAAALRFRWRAICQYNPAAAHARGSSAAQPDIARCRGLHREGQVMRNERLALSLVSAFMLVAGCATSDEWATWKQHPTHFASGDHLNFSARNQNDDPGRAKVTRKDITLARDEGWWGKPVTVSQEQIQER